MGADRRSTPSLTPDSGELCWRGAAGRADRRALGVLIGVAVVLYAVPAAFGHPLMPGDALYQNVPLRALAGDQLLRGEWPLWNPWIWSGTPLLGGLNAGALYPGTFAFAVLGPAEAWVLNQVLIYAVCAAGLYVLLRDHRLVPLAAALGSATFTYAGFMPAHLRHVGLVQGMSLVPWMLVAISRMARARRRARGPDADRSFLAWTLALASFGGLVVLTGEPRSMSNALLFVVAYVAFVTLRHERRGQVVGAVLVAGLVSVAVGAVQLLPGLEFVDASQRGDVGYEFFAFGSLSLPTMSLQVVPYLLGGYTDLGLLPGYRGPFRLPELSGYVGLLPLVALTTVPFWRRRATGRIWLLGTVLVLAGTVLALGGNTPLGEVLAEVPLYGSQRIQSRNLVLVDFGLALLLAAWVDQLLRRGAPPVRRWVERLPALLPSVAVVGLAGAAWAWGPDLQEALEVPVVDPDLFPALGGYLAGAVALALVAAVLVLRLPRLTPRVAVWAVAVFVVADLGLALVHQELGPVESRRELEVSTAESRAVESMLSGGGRFAVYDPETRIEPAALQRAVTPDLTVLHELAMAQGYGSIVEAKYDQVTQTHTRRMIRPAVLDGPLATELDLRLVLVPPSYLGEGAGGAVHPELRDALDSPRWERVGQIGPYAAFESTTARRRIWLEARRGSEDLDGRVTVARRGTQDDETDVVRADAPARLVRSVAYAPGWTAEVRTGTRATTVPVQRRGLLQAVEVPAGTSTVSWSYEAPGFELGRALTLTSTAGIALAAGWLLVRRRRSRIATEGAS